ncbi:PilZ domain-containing protein [bacterium]|nr:PilZ domain-containing protein [bacterium]
MVLKNGEGIFAFTGEVLNFGPVEEARVDIVGIRVIPGTGKTINRREYVRLENGFSCNMILTHLEQKLQASLINLSANGACLETDKSLSMDDYFEVEFKSNFSRPIHFKTAFKVIYDDINPQNNRHQLGVVFLKNVESSQISSLSDVKQRELVRWIDYAMIERRKIENFKHAHV